jgi:hypothetical protein
MSNHRMTDYAQIISRVKSESWDEQKSPVLTKIPGVCIGQIESEDKQCKHKLLGPAARRKVYSRTTTPGHNIQDRNLCHIERFSRLFISREENPSAGEVHS